MVSVATVREALTCPVQLCPCHRMVGDVHCPAHDDRHPSFGIAQHEGRLLVYCRSGCSQYAVIQALIARRLWAAEELPPVHLIAPRPGSPAEAIAAREPWARPGVLAMYSEADYRRHRDQQDRAAIASVRLAAQFMGDTPEAWDLLAEAAAAESAMLARESEEDSGMA